MSGHDLHLFTLKFLALKKVVFSCFQGKNNSKNNLYKGIMQLFSADAIVFSSFFDPKNMKKTPSKVAHNRPRLELVTLAHTQWYMSLIGWVH
jgi:hypothetical protein